MARKNQTKTYFWTELWIVIRELRSVILESKFYQLYFSQYPKLRTIITKL
jgi:hypothetical protein